MNRDEMLARVRARKEPWDIVVIGGGATGAGVAVDAATRGYDVLLLEREDFGKGTSSRATKLVHGGVRYLEQGNLSLVMEALKERGLLLRNAPHIVHDLRFVVPNYSWWEAPFYGIGMKVYDLLAGKYSFGSSKTLSLEETLELLPTIQQDGLRGGVMYHDGQFDDTRLLIHLIADRSRARRHRRSTTAGVTELTKDEDGFVRGVVAVDSETGERFTHPSALRRQCHRHLHRRNPSTRRAERRTDDGPQPGHSSRLRALFSHGRHRASGASDQRRPRTLRHPMARPHARRDDRHTYRRDLLRAAAHSRRRSSLFSKPPAATSARKPTREDILSVFVGIRPLVKSLGGTGGKTSAISRDHTIHIDHSGLLTIAGGKWTTYRHMAEDCVDHAVTLGGLDEKPCVTATTHIHGYDPNPDQFGSLGVYGTDAVSILALAQTDPGLAKPLHRDLPCIKAEIVWSARNEMSRTIDDALARRTRSLLLDARAAVEAAPTVAALLATELGKDSSWAAVQVKDFRALAAQYIAQSSRYPPMPTP